MNTLSKYLSVFVLVFMTSFLAAQEEAAPPADNQSSQAQATRPKDMLEFGIRPTYMFVGGDVSSETGFGIGAHFRKSLDYVFSLRFDGLYGTMKGDNMSNSTSNRVFENDYISGTVLGVISLNNFRFDRSRRTINYYAMVGGGANSFEVTYSGQDGDNIVRDAKIEREFATHAAAGAGIAFRLGSRVNIGLEYQAQIPFGSRADLIDGFSVDGNFRDIVNTASLSFNFNIGNKSKATEPLYWVNPFDPIAAEIDKVAGRVDDATRDSDGDGIVDAIDQEANTPANVPVDTKGRTLDSDKDGVPDFRDNEPFFPPRPGEEVDENGMVINRIDKPITEERVQEMIDAAISDARLNNTTVVEGGDLRELFIPMIYFPLNQHTVKYSDYGTLASVASVLKANPSLRLVVRGYTDKVGDPATNERLSYLRSKSVIDHLVNQHGISRSRFVLQWRGEDENIVPLNQTYLNRRVEFHTATGSDYEQEPPAGVDNGSGGY